MVEDEKKHNKKQFESKIQPVKAPTKPDVTDLIGQRLRTYYSEVAEQPVPDRFLSLLDKLDEATAKKPK